MKLILLFLVVFMAVACSSEKDIPDPHQSAYTGEYAKENTTAESIEAIEPKEPKPIIHVVKNGESLSLIAKHYGVDIKELIKLNNISNPDLIVIGQEIIVPGVVEEEEESF